MATCVETATCFPSSLEEFWELYTIQTGTPVPIVFGLFAAIIILAIYVHTRSIAHLAVMGIYSIAVFSAMWASDAFFEEQIKIAMYVIALSIASVITLMVLKLVKE